MNDKTEQTVTDTLPCPFCGSTKGFFVVKSSTFFWRVLSCRNCGEGTEVRHKNDSYAVDSYIADWNASAPYPAMLRKEIDTLRAQLAEAQRRIKELETPTMFWDFNNPEHGAFGSPYYAICDGDFDEGAEVSFMTARALPTKTVRVTRDSEGRYDYEYIDAAKGEKNGA